MKWSFGKLTKILFIYLTVLLVGCEESKETLQLISINQADKAPTIDGLENDECWNYSLWLPIDQRWKGAPFSNGDFTGSYKLTWDAHALYLLVKIEDDVLVNSTDDSDTLILVMDADNSGGSYSDNYNAFGYNLELNGAIHSNDSSNLLIFKKTTQNHSTLWEVKIPIFADSYTPGAANTPMVLQRNMKIGFMVAYADVDNSNEIENLIGSALMPDTVDSWLDASNFSTLLLK